VRHVEDNFWPSFKKDFSDHGSSGAWEARLRGMNNMAFGSHDIDWKNDNLIFFQIFVGPLEMGHWLLLVCDCTRCKPGILSVFDSLPSYEPGVFEDLKRLLSSTPLVTGRTKWIKARMLKQAALSNDCAVWMCCIAGAYVKCLQNDGVLERLDSTDISCDTGVNEEVVNEIEVTMSPTTTEHIGKLGRKHMLQTFANNNCDLTDEVFNHIFIGFS